MRPSDMLILFLWLVSFAFIGLLIYDLVNGDSDHKHLMFWELVLSPLVCAPIILYELILLSFALLVLRYHPSASDIAGAIFFMFIVLFNPVVLTGIRAALQAYTPNKLYDQSLLVLTILLTLFGTYLPLTMVDGRALLRKILKSVGITKII
jgi:hypothetical protein